MSEFGKACAVSSLGSRKRWTYCSRPSFAADTCCWKAFPGLGKTLLAKSLSRLIGADFQRIQFTPDLMPSDILGTEIINLQTQEFEIRKGPIFTTVLLADEINRTPPKTQAALLEVMEERTVSFAGQTHQLSPIFTVLATQNPVELEGTYPLPEAQVDRFMTKLLLAYPSLEEDLEILGCYNSGVDLHRRAAEEITAVTSPEEVYQCRMAARHRAGGARRGKVHRPDDSGDAYASSRSARIKSARGHSSADA